jgi:hypothetical protein
LRVLIDKALNGATSCRRSRHLTTGGTGWSFAGPRTRASDRGPLPTVAEAKRSLTYERSSDASLVGLHIARTKRCVRDDTYLGAGVIATITTDWLGASGALVGPFVGVVGALWLYSKRRRDEELASSLDRLEAVYLRLRAELDANRRIVTRSPDTIETVLSEQAPDRGANDPIHDERLYLAPLFTQSWDLLAQTDAERVLSSAELERLFRYYTAIARANWLIPRVQVFQFRAPILREIRATLREVQDPKGDVQVDLSGLQRALAPRLAQT